MLFTFRGYSPKWHYSVTWRRRIVEESHYFCFLCAKKKTIIFNKNIIIHYIYLFWCTCILLDRVTQCTRSHSHTHTHARTHARTHAQTHTHTRYLYGGVVFIHKVVLDELDGESALAHASSTHHHQLIFSHPLQPLATPEEKPAAPSIDKPYTAYSFTDFYYRHGKDPLQALRYV